MFLSSCSSCSSFQHHRLKISSNIFLSTFSNDNCQVIPSLKVEQLQLYTLSKLNCIWPMCSSSMLFKFGRYHGKNAEDRLSKAMQADCYYWITVLPTQTVRLMVARLHYSCSTAESLTSGQGPCRWFRAIKKYQLDSMNSLNWVFFKLCFSWPGISELWWVSSCAISANWRQEHPRHQSAV